MDRFMNSLFQVVVYSSVGVIGYIIYNHFSQKHEAAKYAGLITEQIKHGRGQAFVSADNSIVVCIDNLIVDVISKEKVEAQILRDKQNLKQNNNDDGK